MRRFLAFLMFVPFLFSCGQKPVIVPEEGTLTLERDQEDVGCNAITFVFNIFSNCNWHIEGLPDWVSVEPNMADYFQSTQLLFRITENKSVQLRECDISFVYADAKAKVFHITQAAFVPYLTLSEQQISFGYRESQKSIAISSNCGWTASVNHDWVAIRPSTGLVGVFEIIVMTSTNPTQADRTTAIHIWNQEYNLESILQVMQAHRQGAEEMDYIDEYGINWGKGIVIHSLEWAPVNCGYHPEDYTFGKLFQWGRRWGLGYQDAVFQDATKPEIASVWTGHNGEEAPSSFYLPNDASLYGYDWIMQGSNQYWNLGTEEYPLKNPEHDPCPEGWRVPTSFEFNSLVNNSTDPAWNSLSGQNGYLFKDTEDNNSLFLPAGGRLNTQDGIAYERNTEGYYWTITTESGNPAYLFFYSGNCSINKQGSRAGACLVRCVRE